MSRVGRDGAGSPGRARTYGARVTDQMDSKFLIPLDGARHEIRFVDSAGRHWHRNVNGVLALTGRDELVPGGTVTESATQEGRS